jgi:hypothetical protein
MVNNKYYKYLWPKIWDVFTAIEAMRNGLIVVYLIIAVNSFDAILKLYGINFFSSSSTYYEDFFEALVWVSIGIGIYYYSRVATVIGLIDYIAERIIMWLYYEPENLIIFILFTLYLFHAVRGSFAYHRFIKSSILYINIIKKILITIGYSILLLSLMFGIFNVLVKIFSIRLNYEIFKILSLYFMIGIIVTYFLTFKEYLPFTKNKPIVIVKLTE